MRLISLNAWGGRLAGPLLSYLAAEDPDVLCLQEVTAAPAPCPEVLYFRHDGAELEQAADLFGRLRERLPGHDAAFFPAMRGTLEDAEGRPHASLFGLATFTRRSLPVLEQQLAFTHGAFRPDGWGPAPVPRNAHGFRLYNPATGRATTIVQTHGLRDPKGKHDTPARRAQARRLLRLVRALRRPGEGAILCGDLNLLPGAESFGILAAEGLADLVTARGHCDSRTSWYPKPQRFADYLLVTPEVQVTGFDLPARPEISDHRPLVLDFA